MHFRVQRRFDLDRGDGPTDAGPLEFYVMHRGRDYYLYVPCLDKGGQVDPTELREALLEMLFVVERFRTDPRTIKQTFQK